MSWDADLMEPCEPYAIHDPGWPIETISEIAIGDWNYTHNCNGMANAAAIDAGHRQMMRERNIARWRAHDRADVADRYEADPEYRGSWWGALDGMSGPEGASFLNDIILRMEKDPERFRAMNPENGWGDFDSFLEVLQEMRAAVPERICTWRTSG